MTNSAPRSLGSIDVEQDFGPEEDGPFFSWLPPDDRLWRHPSEVHSDQPSAVTKPSKSSRSRFAGSPAQRAFTSPNGRVWMVALFAGAIGAMAASGIGIASGAFNTQTTVIRPIITSTPVSLADDTPGPADSFDWTTVDDEVAPAVVGITVSSAGSSTAGSGLLLFDSGYGNAYVVTDQSLFASSESTGSGTDIDVMFLAGNEVKGRLVGADALSGIALIEVPDGHVTPPALGSVAYLQVAEAVMAVGSRSAASVVQGSVSAEDRTVNLPESTDMDDLIAVSTPPMPSTGAGGPLLDESGQVVGITVSLDPTDTTDQGLTFAVPIDEAKRVAEEMVNGEVVTHPWVGLTDIRDLPSSMAHQMGVTGGAQAGTVWPGSPADRSGLSAGDIITSFDGQPVESAGSLLSDLDACVPGRLVPISFIHAGQTISSRVEVTNEPGDS